MDSCLPKAQTSLNNGLPVDQDLHQDHTSTRPWPKPQSLPLKPSDSRENRGVVHPNWEDPLLGQSEPLFAGHSRPHFPLYGGQSQQVAIPTLGPNQHETVTLNEYRGHACEQHRSEQPTDIMPVSSQFMTRSPPANKIEQSLDKSSELEDEEDSWPTEGDEWWT
ncbi:hypothetical protein N7537_011388 [Penicillium hordei]|uniref:Uncharacterized protein n=1 Tax=Penicillium hordei TaxID=40994 RepID=A0AAD6DLN9_9EURO|nr:uncharacterized protein N7537_011388 [Penicillium hordei]KAJ5588710.1 hypothetical protein N7537_011388 [Penicillium hordei]